MAKQNVDIGVEGNDNTGDSIRESFRKVNENFTELEAIVNNTVTVEGENVGTGIGLFKGKFVSNLQFIFQSNSRCSLMHVDDYGRDWSFSVTFIYCYYPIVGMT